MQPDPYNLYVTPRPLRIAFLVAPGSASAVDHVVEYNRELWGGRFNPILQTDGQSLDDDAFAFLRQFDPDVINPLVPLSEDLLKRINTFLSPFSVERPRGYDNAERLIPEPLSIVPNAATVSRVAGGSFGLDSTLTLFEVKNEAPAAVREFVERNFGGLFDGPGTLWNVREALKSVTTQTYVISSIESLAVALAELGEYKRVVFHSQLCAQNDTLPDVQHHWKADHFTVVLGDEASDVNHAWNRIACVPQWLRASFHQLWLPTTLARDESLRPSLIKFLRRYADSTGNQNGKGASFVSCSLGDAALAAIATELSQSIGYRHSHARVPVVPQVKPSSESPVVNRDRQLRVLFRGHSVEEHLVLPEPDRAFAPGGIVWCADIEIEYRPERLTHIIGAKRWWQFPPKNSLLADTHFFNRPARIRRDRFPSVRMERPQTFSHDDGTLVVKVPTDLSVGRALVCAPEFSSLESRSKTPRPFPVADPSDKGETLNGVLGLFPSLYSAEQVFSERYWRSMFETMSRSKAGAEDKRADQIYAWLKKHNVNWDTPAKVDEGLRGLATKALEYSKLYSSDTKTLTLEDFLRKAIRENEEHNAVNPTDLVPCDTVEARAGIQAELRDSLSLLVARRVVQMGVLPKCPHCGFRIWYSLDEATQRIQCSGCTEQYHLSADEPWHYRLNSLVSSAVGRHGTVPVLLVLAQLSSLMRTSFFFVPPMDLFRPSATPPKYDHVGDLDIVCILDGQFIIGEVKTNANAFTVPEFDQMLTIAKALKPDRVIFSALEGSPSASARRHLGRLQIALEPLEVKVEWLALNADVTAPSPIHWEVL